MFATSETIQNLENMQQAMLARTKAQTKLDTLPQRQEILHLRQKKAQIEEKAEQVNALLQKAHQELTRITSDDERMSARQNEKQQEIENASAAGNFRAVENLSKELETVAQKREALIKKNDAACAQLEKVETLKAHINAALAAVQEKEQASVASFQSQGGALQSEIARYNAFIEQARSALPSDIYEQFQNIAKRSGGVAIGKLENGRCGCCRVSIDEAHLISLRSQAPLATCPACKRLLVIS